MKKIKFMMLFLLITNIFYSINYPELTGRVVDLANVLSSSEFNDLEKRLEQYDNNTGNQMAICFIETTDSYSIEEYSIRLAEKWKIGYKGKDNGIIMLFAMKDRKMRIEVGYGLEADLTDLEAKLLIEKVLVPHFKNSKYYEGIKKAIDYIEKETSLISSDTEKNIITKKLQPKEHKLWVKDKNTIDIILFAIIILAALLAFLFDLFITNKIHYIFPLINLIIEILIILFFSFIFKIDGFSFPALGGLAIIGFVVGFIILAFITPSSGSTYGGSGSSSSYSGYSGSSSSYSGSSYSGGGGSFGGGGASGSW